MENQSSYTNSVAPGLRYEYCPFCAAHLTQGSAEQDNTQRVDCPRCGWVYHPAHVVAVNVIISARGGLVAVLPHDEPIGTPAALPAGRVTCAESPADAAIRTASEITGLVVEAASCLGWYYGARDVFPDPGVTFMFEARAVGGMLRDSAEGRARVFSLRDFPSISPNRAGSTRTMRAYLAGQAGP